MNDGPTALLKRRGYRRWTKRVQSSLGGVPSPLSSSRAICLTETPRTESSSFRGCAIGRSMVEGERDSVRIQSALMQINADAVCLVRTQFQQVIELLFLKLPSHPMSSILFRCATSLLSALQGHE